MRKVFTKVLVSLILSVFMASPLLADSAKVTFVKGKVEVSRNGSWIPLKAGDLVAVSETISTGFQSEARLNLNGSVLAVAAMSRVTLEALSSSASKDNVSLYINTGAVRSKVSHTEGKKVDFTTHTAVAVASVRGTDYTITANGNVRCHEGAVAVYSAKNYNPSRKTSNRREEAPADEPAADATTPSDEISESAPVNTVVVGAGQQTSFGNGNNPEKPMEVAKKQAEKAKNTTKTAAEKDAAASGATTPAVKPTPAAPATGGIEVIIRLPGDKEPTYGLEISNP
ncbi:MAG: FecR family protein [Treponema sp.]|nr:FecR family protein [Treponema sp.]